ncbi:MAG: hypothetical protein LQ338_006989 [Usnochroma carphineum]|nr:MAG: hypothetical protein LQ338_006989 [Usnochroma carphineum]
MSKRNRKASVCTEDILTSRGANPRTGVISPYIVTGALDASDKSDYVRVGRVQNDCDLKIGPGERWRQDALGWSLVGSAIDDSDKDATTTSRSNADAAGTAPEQTDVSRLCAPDSSLSPFAREHGSTDQNARSSIYENITAEDIRVSSPTWVSQSTSSRTQSESSFRIPRKDVGSNSASPKLTRTPRQQEVPTFGNIRHEATLRDKALRCNRPVHLDSTALLSHGDPVAPSGGRSSYYNKAIPLPAKKGHGSPGLADLCQNRRPSHTDIFAPVRFDSLQPLQSTYRRPKELFPARLCGRPTNRGNSHSQNTDSVLDRPTNPTIEQRPQFKRVQATTAVPVAHSVKNLDHCDSKKIEALSAPSPEKAAPGQPGDAVEDAASRTAKSSPISPSTRAARIAFLDVRTSQPHPTKSRAYPARDVEQSPPSLNIHGAQSDLRAVSASERIPEISILAKTQLSPKSSHPKVHNKDESKHARGQHSLVRCKSVRNATEVQASLLALTREICSLVDVNRLSEQLSEVLDHAALTFRQMPWAIQTLRSQDVKVWDYLLAVRYMVTTLIYFAMLLCFVTGVLKLSKLVVDLGSCFWYPISLLLTTIRWVLMH